MKKLFSLFAAVLIAGSFMTAKAYYLVGTLAENGWTAESATEIPDEGLVRSVAAGTYEFKVLTTLGSWDDALNYTNVNAECSSEGYEDGDNHNIKVVLANDGDVTVKVVDGQICVSVALNEVVEPVFECDWDNIAYLGGDAAYADRYKFCSETASVVNIQTPGFASEVGIYMTVGAAITACSLGEGNYAVQGAGMVAYLSALTAEYNEFTITDGNGTVHNVTIYNNNPINYFLVGTLAVNGWDAASAMPMNGDAIVRSVAAGTYSFKVLTARGSWDGALNYSNVDAECSSEGYEDGGGNDHNIQVTLANAGDVTVSVVGGMVCVTGTFGEIEITSYTIAGVTALTGADWNPANTANDMTENDGTWTLLRENVVLTAGTYKYKVAANHAWNVADYPASGDYQLTISETGTYNVTFTWVPETNTLSATAVKQVFECDWEHIAYLGNGSGDAANTDRYKFCSETASVVNIQTPGFASEAGIYMTVPAAITACSLGEGSYAADGAGLVAYLSALTAEYNEFTITDANGNVHNVTVYNNAPVVVYTVVGEDCVNGDTDWDTDNTDNDMTLQPDGTYQLYIRSIYLEKGFFSYKMVKDHAWGIYEIPASGNQQFEAWSAGYYQLTYTFNPETEILKVDVILSGQWPTAIENNDATSSQKFIHEGNLYILRDGKVYNVLGTRM